MAIEKVVHNQPTVVGGVDSFPAENSLIDRVIQVVVSIFETLKQKIVLFWNALATWSQNTWTASSFVFFRAMDYIYPTLSANVERGYLYMTNFFNSYTEAHLRERNDILTVRAEDAEKLLNKLAEEKNALRDKLRDLENRDELTNLDLKHLTENYTNLESKYQALITEKNTLQQNLALVKTDQEINQELLNSLTKEKDNFHQTIQTLLAERDSWKPRLELNLENVPAATLNSGEPITLEERLGRILSTDQSPNVLEALRFLQPQQIQ